MGVSFQHSSKERENGSDTFSAFWFQGSSNDGVFPIGLPATPRTFSALVTRLRGRIEGPGVSSPGEETREYADDAVDWVRVRALSCADDEVGVAAGSKGDSR